MKHRYSIRELDTTGILHPLDKSTIETLGNIPGFKTFVDKTVVNIMEKYAEIESSGDGVNITATSVPTVYCSLVDACRILNINEVPACSTDWCYDISFYSIGEKKRRIILQSGTIDLLSQDELLFVLGHELGHMKCGHKTYHMLTEAMYMPVLNSDFKIWVNLIKMPLLNWYRYSDFTADRMGLLCCQDINTALSTMIKMAGLPKKYYSQANINAFIQQAIDFNKEHSGTIDNIIKYLSINAACMPWLVLRASELLDWYNSSEFDRIVRLNKEYASNFK